MCTSFRVSPFDFHFPQRCAVAFVNFQTLFYRLSQFTPVSVSADCTKTVCEMSPPFIFASGRPLFEFFIHFTSPLMAHGDKNRFPSGMNVGKRQEQKVNLSGFNISPVEKLIFHEWGNNGHSNTCLHFWGIPLCHLMRRIRAFVSSSLCSS